MINNFNGLATSRGRQDLFPKMGRLCLGRAAVHLTQQVFVSHGDPSIPRDTVGILGGVTLV